jgi:hypothetical protein
MNPKKSRTIDERKPLALAIIALTRCDLLVIFCLYQSRFLFAV